MIYMLEMLRRCIINNANEKVFFYRNMPKKKDNKLKIKYF